MRAMIVEEALAKNSQAISATGDGQGSSGKAWCRNRSGLRGVWHQRDLLSLPGQAAERKRRDRQLARAPDRQ